MASHVPIQPSGMPAPLPVQPLPPRASASASPAPAGVPTPAVVELRPTPGTEPAAAPPPAVSLPSPSAPSPAAAAPPQAPAPIGIAAVGPAPATTEAPTATSVTFRVFARLSDGERIEVGTHADEESAKAEATALMRFLKADGGDWPFLDGRFVRPEAIVSVDVVSG